MGEITEEDATEPKLTVEENIDSAPPRKTALDSVRCCLFCNEDCEGVKKCLDHMRTKHSFTILDVDCLVDLKGLLNYMAQRVHIGFLCLFCSKQFSDGRRCQQHMQDKSHCVMNMEDEDEYLDFYDFSKTYENHPLLIKDDTLAIKEAEPDKEEESKAGAGEAASEGEGWEDCDMEDADSNDGKEEETTNSFEIVDAPSSETTKSFTIVDKPSTEGDDDGIESLSSIQSNPTKPKGDNKTREEAFLGLNIKKAKLLPSGEVLLGNGKIMGTRQFHYIYKQKPRLPDTREAVLINKMALQYRRLRAIQEAGGKSANQIQRAYMSKEEKAADIMSFKGRQRWEKHHQKKSLKTGMQASICQHYFVDPTAHL